mmetsp:Transcript_20475/g.40536  ORF Transcript_20475/g.40536 Transcript_20475/m.40536 type:complete len:119 (-) Transcript_20475:22-378(-)
MTELPHYLQPKRPSRRRHPPSCTCRRVIDVLRDEGELYAGRLADAIGEENVELVRGAGTHVGSLFLNRANADVMIEIRNVDDLEDMSKAWNSPQDGSKRTEVLRQQRKLQARLSQSRD